MKINNLIIPVAIAAAVAGGGGFFGGMKYDASKTPIRPTGQFQNLGNGQRTGGANGAVRRYGGGMISGEILSKDDKNVTVKDAAGGSKIIFLSPSTTISKMADGSVDDLAIGKTIIINGAANADGSVAAQSIQIRPTISNPMPAPIKK